MLTKKENLMTKDESEELWRISKVNEEGETWLPMEIEMYLFSLTMYSWKSGQRAEKEML